ncbi:MAG: PEP-CTERM sorting domain-containing protein [Pyrinomonadaceae bacterium]
MTISFTKILRGVAFSTALLVIVGASHTAARADEVTITGSTTGVVTGVPQLTFTGNSLFTGTTAFGFGSLSGPNSLGSFFLSTAPTELVSGVFTLNVTFTTPAGIIGGQGTSYTAVISGTVSPNIDQGGVFVQFVHAPFPTFTFNDGVNTGSFSLQIAHLFVQSGQAANLTAGIRGQQAPAVPEPATLLLLGSGITGIAVKLRRRRKAKLAAETAEV